MDLTFITGNPAKAEQLARYLNLPVQHLKLDLPEIPSLDLQEIVIHKAKQAFLQANSPVIVEDTSLTFAALGKLPGPLIKWFLQELDNEGMCNLLNSYQDRTAVATVLFGYCDEEKVETFSGQMHGSISPQPLGDRGFGLGSHIYS